MRILTVDNLQIRKWGAPKVATDRKLVNGYVRNNFRTLEFSDRDVAAMEAPLGLRDLGRRAANRRLIETARNWQPDMVQLGHCDIIRNETLAEIRQQVPGVRIAFRNVDPLFDPANVSKIDARADHVDAIFITTGGEKLRRFKRAGNVVSFIPNPCDPAIEDMDNSARPADAFERDLVFCGVGNPTDPRYPLVKRLHDALDGAMRFTSFGMHGPGAVWGLAYDKVLAGSKMALNLNRTEGDYLYSSARMSQLMGNGLLTFMDEACGYRKFFGDGEAGFFGSEDELVAKIRQFHADDAKRRAVAGAGRRFYQTHFSGEMVGRFIVETTMGTAYSRNYLWADEVVR
ncbi:MAG TPA: glycosyltransferase [Micropepsaceae bacterium]|nr:glycosyltransferase [Micropepsaceae bacterium]